MSSNLNGVLNEKASKDTCTLTRSYSYLNKEHCGRIVIKFKQLKNPLTHFKIYKDMALNNNCVDFPQKTFVYYVKT